MKRFWNKVNRGLLLGGVLLVGLICFIIVKEVVFRTELPEIRDTVKASVEAMLGTNLSGKDTRPGDALSEMEKKTMRDRLEDVLVEYWASDGDEAYYYTAYEVREAYEKYLSETYVVFDEITLNLSDDDIRITPNGADYVKVEVSIESLSAVFRGNGDMMFCGFPVWGEPMEGGFAYKQLRGSYEGFLEMELHRVSGEWRVCGIAGYLSVTSASEMGGDQ